MRFIGLRARTLSPRLMRHMLQRGVDGVCQRSDRLRVRLLSNRLKELLGDEDSRTWHVHGLNWTLGRVSVAFVGPRGGESSVVVKLPHSSEGTASLKRLRDVQSTFHRDSSLAQWRSVVPEPLAEGYIGGQYFLVEEAVPGCAVAGLYQQALGLEDIQSRSAQLIMQLHHDTSHEMLVGPSTVKRWVVDPIDGIREATSGHTAVRHYEKCWERLKQELCEALIDQRVQVSWIHGDFWLGNVLVEPQSGRLTGIIDWDRAAPDQLPLHDLLHLLFLTRKLATNRWDDRVIASAVQGRLTWSDQEQEILDIARRSLPPAIADVRLMVLLYWLRHVTNTLSRLPRLKKDPVYLADNIGSVLRHI